MKIMVCGAGAEIAAVTEIIQRQMMSKDVIIISAVEHANSLTRVEPTPLYAPPMIFDVVNNGVAKSGKQLRRERRAMERKK